MMMEDRNDITCEAKSILPSNTLMDRIASDAKGQLPSITLENIVSEAKGKIPSISIEDFASEAKGKLPSITLEDNENYIILFPPARPSRSGLQLRKHVTSPEAARAALGEFPPYHVVCSQLPEQHGGVVCSFFTQGGETFYEAHAQSAAEARVLVELITSQELCLCPGLSDDAVQQVSLSEVMVERKSSGFRYRSRECPYLILRDPNQPLCGHCHDLSEISSDKLSSGQPRQVTSLALLLEARRSRLLAGKSAKLRGRPKVPLHACHLVSCPRQFSNKQELARHVKREHRQLFLCNEPAAAGDIGGSVCTRHFGSEVELTQHRRRHRKEFSHFCSICSRGFVNQKELSLHMSAVHLPGAGVPEFGCSLCGKIFTRQANLNTHMTVHTGEKKFYCQPCEKSYTRKSHLIEHRQRVHVGLRLFQCEQCSRRFSATQQLQRHTAAVHNDERPFLCQYCNSKFSRSHHLKVHLKRKHSAQQLEEEAPVTQSVTAVAVATAAMEYDIEDTAELTIETSEAIIETSEATIEYSTGPHVELILGETVDDFLTSTTHLVFHGD